jgi:hypothetical protein
MLAATNPKFRRRKSSAPTSESRRTTLASDQANDGIQTHHHVYTLRFEADGTHHASTSFAHVVSPLTCRGLLQSDYPAACPANDSCSWGRLHRRPILARRSRTCAPRICNVQRSTDTLIHTDNIVVPIGLSGRSCRVVVQCVTQQPWP